MPLRPGGSFNTGRSHWICGEPGWEEVADFALDWAVANARGA